MSTRGPGAWKLGGLERPRAWRIFAHEAWGPRGLGAQRPGGPEALEAHEAWGPGRLGTRRHGGPEALEEKRPEELGPPET